MRGRMLIIGMALTALAGGCASGPNGGMTQMRSDAVPHAEAHQRCFEIGMGAPYSGGSGLVSRERAYAACMSRAGWEDRRTM